MLAQMARPQRFDLPAPRVKRRRPLPDTGRTIDSYGLANGWMSPLTFDSIVIDKNLDVRGLNGLS